MSCHDRSCETKHHHHHHLKQSSCCSGCCSCYCHHHEEDEEYDECEQLLDIADEAWLEVLKEKIKEHIRASDHKIDDIARIVAETNREHWHHKMSEEKTWENYEDELSRLFDQPSSTKGKKK